MKKFRIYFLTLLLGISMQSIAQQVNINVNSVPASLVKGTSGYIEVNICNVDVNNITAPANKLRPLISVPGNVTITGVTDVSGNPLTGFTVLSLGTGTGNSIRLLATNPLPNFECFDFHVTIQAVNVGSTDVVTGTLGFAGPPTTNDLAADNNSTTGIAVTAAPPIANDDNAGTTSVPIQITVLTNDTPGSSPIDVTKVMLIDPGTNAPSTHVFIQGEGTYDVNTTTGVVTFTPDPTLTTDITSTIKYTITDTNNLISNQATITVNAKALPVTLVSFNVQKEGKTALLKWATTEETNSEYFEIQHSVTGKEWAEIDRVLSHGESTTLKNYTFTHTTPVNGENLYRLKMVDKDATYAYSRIQSVKFDGIGSDLSVYPNPATDKLFIRDFSQVTQVKINDLNGRSVYQAAGSATGEVDVKNLSTGIYIVNITRANGIKSSQKIVISK